MTIADWMQAIAAVLTLVGTIFILLTLLEMRSQRRSAYLPDLVVEARPSAHCRVGPEGPYWTAGEPGLGVRSVPESPVPGNQGGLSFYVSNLGMGAARNIYLSWEYDLNLAFDLAYSLASEKPSVDRDSFLLVIPYPWEGALVQSLAVNLDLDLSGNIDHVLPAISDAISHPVPVPHSYLALLGACTANFSASVKSGAANFINPPTLMLQMTWSDIGGGVHRKEFIASFRMSTFANNEASWSVEIRSMDGNARRRRRRPVLDGKSSG